MSGILSKQDQENPNRFDVYEEFVDKAAFNFQQARVQGSKRGRVQQSAVVPYLIFALEIAGIAAALLFMIKSKKGKGN